MAEEHEPIDEKDIPIAWTVETARVYGEQQMQVKEEWYYLHLTFHDITDLFDDCLHVSCIQK